MCHLCPLKLTGKEEEKSKQKSISKNLMHCSDYIKEIRSGKGGNAEGCVVHVAIACTVASWNRAKMRQGWF